MAGQGRVSFGILLVRLLLRVAKWVMPAPPNEVHAYIERARALVAKMDRWTPPFPADVSVEAFRIGEVAAYWIRAPGVSRSRAMLYLQGGAYILGAPTKTHRDLIWRLSAACDCTVLAIEYGLAPEHLYPVASDQALAAWRCLLEKFPATSLALAGDSAGGNLALSTALRIRDTGLPLPAALCLLSALTDMTASGESVRRNFKKDLVIPGNRIRPIAELFTNGTRLDHPHVSPIFGEFHGLPPTLLQVGSDEVLLDDSVRVAEKMQAAGVPVLLDVWKGMPHVWQGFAAFIPEARAAIDDIGRFVRGHLRTEPPT